MYRDQRNTLMWIWNALQAGHRKYILVHNIRHIHKHRVELSDRWAYNCEIQRSRHCIDTVPRKYIDCIAESNFFWMFRDFSLNLFYFAKRSWVWLIASCCTKHGLPTLVVRSAHAISWLVGIGIPSAHGPKKISYPFSNSSHGIIYLPFLYCIERSLILRRKERCVSHQKSSQKLLHI